MGPTRLDWAYQQVSYGSEWPIGPANSWIVIASGGRAVTAF